MPTLNSTTIMELDAVPAHLLVLGGGYIGLEFGQMFRRFGSAVTIVQRGGQLLAREDADVAEEVATIMREDGIEVLLNTQAERVEQSSDGSIQMTVSSAEGKRTLNSSHLLVAAGRTPNTDMLSLEAAGIETTKRGHVVVNERLETSVPGIYALGDVNGGPAFTHISYDDYRIAETDQILGCAILGIEGSEIMSALQIAMMGRLPYTALRDGIFAHPTLMESLNNLFSLVE